MDLSGGFLTRRVPARPVALLAALSLGLSGCSLLGGESENAAESKDVGADWGRIAISDSTVAVSKPAFAVSDVVGAVGKLPVLAVGVKAEPGKKRAAMAFVPGKDDPWTAITLPTPDGDADVSSAFSDGKSTWVAGSTWTAEKGEVPFVVRSENRSDWDEVTLPSAMGEALFLPEVGLALAGGVPVLAGLDRGGQPTVATADDGFALDALPKTQGSRIDSFVDMARVGDVVVIVATAKRDGAPDTFPVFVSPDLGKTWNVTDGPANAHSIQGVAGNEHELLSTGAVLEDGERVPAAWSSKDGITWKPEKLPDPAERSEYYSASGQEGAWLGSPTATPAGGFVVPHVLEHEAQAAVLDRGADGKWQTRGFTPGWLTPGGNRLLGANVDGSVTVAESRYTAARLGNVSSNGGWSGATVLGQQQHPVSWDAFSADARSVVLFGSRQSFDLQPSGAWTQRSTSLKYAVGDDQTLSPSPWDPQESAEIGDLVEVADDGTTVVMGATVVEEQGESTVRLMAWHRGGPQAEWSAATGLKSDSSDYANGLAHLGTRWIAAGGSREDFNASSQTIAAVWTSADGAKWQRASGPFHDKDWYKSTAMDVCALPDGTPLVVGAMIKSGEIFSVAWILRDGKWSRIDQAPFAKQVGQLHYCSTDGHTTLLQGEANHREVLWRTQDGKTFEKVDLGAPGDDFRRIRAIEGGFAAVGTRDAKQGGGAVVWLSTDGKEWRSLPLPAEHRMSGADVLEHEGRLLAAANYWTGPEIWSLTDPRNALSANSN